MRTFKVVRNEDVSGVSGTGVVAQGVIFDSGRVAVEWLTSRPTIEVAADLEDYTAIHGHGGKTEIILDSKDPQPASELEEKVRQVLAVHTMSIEHSLAVIAENAGNSGYSVRRLDRHIKEILKSGEVVHALKNILGENPWQN